MNFQEKCSRIIVYVRRFKDERSQNFLNFKKYIFVTVTVWHSIMQTYNVVGQTVVEINIVKYNNKTADEENFGFPDVWSVKFVLVLIC